VSTQSWKPLTEALTLEVLSYAATKYDVATTVRLFHETITAINKLFAYASAEAGKGNNYAFADYVLAVLPQICTEKALHLSASAPDSWAGIHLADALAESVGKLTDAVTASPGPFIKGARRRLQWPVLYSVRGKGAELEALAEKIQLGGDYQVKAKGAINFSTISTNTVATAVLALSSLNTLFKQGGILPRVAPSSLNQLGRIEFPPLTADPDVLRFWGECGVRPFVESLKDNLMASPALENYRGAAFEALRQGRTKAKVDTRAWNLFITDCRKALQRIAPPVTDKTTKNP